MQRRHTYISKILFARDMMCSSADHEELQGISYIYVSETYIYPRDLHTSKRDLWVCERYLRTWLVRTGWRRGTGCLIFDKASFASSPPCLFPPRSPTVSGSFAESDLQLKASYACSQSCMWLTVRPNDCIVRCRNSRLYYLYLNEIYMNFKET